MELENPQTATWRPSRILAALDLSPRSNTVLQYAALVARHFDAQIYLTHVLPEAQEPSSGDNSAAAHEQLSTLLKSAEMTEARGVVLLARGFLWQTLDALIRQYKIDLLVAGTHGCNETTEESEGTRAELFSRHAGCPVLTVGPHILARDAALASTLANILFATDFGKASKHAIPYACALAREYKAKLTLVHVLDTANNDSIQGAAIQREITKTQLLESVPEGTAEACKADFVVRVGDAVREILNVADSARADLIVMGAKSGKTLLSHLPEPTTCAVIAAAKCPVLTVRN
jgi:nucleotide-binding universal stress UspA family protein